MPLVSMISWGLSTSLGASHTCTLSNLPQQGDVRGLLGSGRRTGMCRSRTGCSNAVLWQAPMLGQSLRQRLITQRWHSSANTRQRTLSFGSVPCYCIPWLLLQYAVFLH